MTIRMSAAATVVAAALALAPPVLSPAPAAAQSRIAMAGHSIGGNAAAATMATDPRVLAGVTMDGTFFAPVPAGGLDARPFMLFGMPAHGTGSVDETWDRDWPKLDGWKRWLTVTGTAHIDFSDLSVLADQVGLTDPNSPLSGERTAEIMRDYVGAFFDLHLRGTPRPLLDGPTPENPEVVFHQPGSPAQLGAQAGYCGVHFGLESGVVRDTAAECDPPQ